MPINDAVEIKYIVDDYGNNGIDNPEWPFYLMKMGGDVCMISKDSGEIVERMESQVFNSIVYFWLMLDAPHLFDGLSEH